MNKPPLTEEEIFRFAYQLSSPEARLSYLKQVCRDETEMERIVALLSECATDASFLESRCSIRQSARQIPR